MAFVVWIGTAYLVVKVLHLTELESVTERQDGVIGGSRGCHTQTSPAVGVVTTSTGALSLRYFFGGP